MNHVLRTLRHSWLNFIPLIIRLIKEIILHSIFILNDFITNDKLLLWKESVCVFSCFSNWSDMRLKWTLPRNVRCHGETKSHIDPCWPWNVEVSKCFLIVISVQFCVRQNVQSEHSCGRNANTKSWHPIVKHLQRSKVKGQTKMELTWSWGQAACQPKQCTVKSYFQLFWSHVLCFKSQSTSDLQHCDIDQ